MNYLAHALLAGDDPEWIVGGFLGDHVRGDRWRGQPPHRAAGIRFHRDLDQAMDSHPAVVEARAAFGDARRYAGIIIDIGFDHLLAKDWDAQAGSERSLEEFAAYCHRLLAACWEELPASLQRFLAYAERFDQLVAYREEAGIDRALKGVATRLSRPGPLVDGWQALASRMPLVEAAFDAAWHEFVARAPAMRAAVARETTQLLETTP